MTAYLPPVFRPSLPPIGTGSSDPVPTPVQKFIQWAIGCIPPEQRAAAVQEVKDFIEHLEKVGVQTAIEEAKHVFADTTESSAWNADFQHNFDGMRK